MMESRKQGVVVKLAETKEHRRLIGELADWAKSRGFDEELDVLPGRRSHEVLLLGKVNNDLYLFMGRSFIAGSKSSTNGDLQSNLEMYVTQLYNMVNKQQVSGGVISISTNDETIANVSAALLQNLYKTHSLSKYEDKDTEVKAIRLSEKTWILDMK